MNETLPVWRWALGGALLTSVFGLSLWGLTVTEVRADRDEYKHDGGGWTSRNTPVSPLYRDECSSCHLAYPVGMLPAASWQAIMAGLEDHFGENAELDQDTQDQIETYLVSGAADNSRYKNRRYLTSALTDDPLLRITELPYFIRKHDEIPARWVQGNDKVGSFSRCESCHQGAAQGDFDEDAVVVPGYGRWED